MHEYIIQLVENKVVFYGLLVLILLVFLRSGWALGSSFTRKKAKKQFKEMEKEKNIFQRENKKMWDEDKKSLLEKNKNLEDLIKRNEKRLEDYRRKLSGMGTFSFGESKKRTDILYSLIMENELLEQIIQDQAESLTTQHQVHVDQRLLDIKKRQRLLAEIFDDKKIKEYVHEEMERQNLIKKIEQSKKNEKTTLFSTNCIIYSCIVMGV